MRVRARAPGKLVILGEYAVLEGAEALVMAVDRHCVASIATARTGDCRLEIRAPDPEPRRFACDEPSGVPLVDIVVEALGPARGALAWRGVLDTRAFFRGRAKLGLGSSAAALVAFAGAWARVAGAGDDGIIVKSLIALHRRFQGGAGSGLDIAAAVTGGVLEFRLEGPSEPRIGSVRLPNSVGFAGIFTGIPAATADFVARFEAWKAARPGEARERLAVLGELAAEGCAAVRAGDAAGFIGAMGRYGRQLERLGEDIGREIVTADHREIRALAEKFGVTYKVSGAGGGDLGIAFCSDTGALDAFGQAVRATRYEWIDLGVDPDGLVVEEQV